MKCKLEISPAAEEVVEGDGGGGEGLGDGHGEPDAGVAEQAGHDDEARDDEDEAAQAGEEHGGLHLLEALEEADGGYVGDVEDVAEGEEGQAVDGDAGGVALLADEQAYEGAGQEHEYGHPDSAADDGGDDGQAAGGRYPVHPAGSVVEADNRLCGLGHGVAEHEDEGGVVAGHTEGAYAVVSEVAHEDLVAHEHEDGDGGLTEQGWGAYLALIADVAHTQAHTLAAHFQFDQAHNPGPQQQIADAHAAAYDDADACGYGRTLDAHSEREDEEPVEDGVDQSRYDRAPHGVLRRSVQADDEERHREPHLEGQGRDYPQQVVQYEGHQMFRGAEHPGRSLGEGHDETCYERGYDSHEEYGLGDIEPGGFDLAAGQVNRCYHGTARTGHQPETGEYHPYRYADIDGGYTVAAYSVPYEDTVDGRDRRHAHHPQQCGYEILTEQGRDVYCSKIDSIALHITACA